MAILQHSCCLLIRIEGVLLLEHVISRVVRAWTKFVWVNPSRDVGRRSHALLRLFLNIAENSWIQNAETFCLFLKLCWVHSLKIPNDKCWGYVSPNVNAGCMENSSVQGYVPAGCFEDPVTSSHHKAPSHTRSKVFSVAQRPPLRGP